MVSKKGRAEPVRRDITLRFESAPTPAAGSVSERLPFYGTMAGSEEGSRVKWRGVDWIGSKNEKLQRPRSAPRLLVYYGASPQKHALADPISLLIIMEGYPVVSLLYCEAPSKGKRSSQIRLQSVMSQGAAAGSTCVHGCTGTVCMFYLLTSIGIGC